MEIELFLSRTAYRAGTPVVGSIRIRCSDVVSTNNSSQAQNVRSMIASARLYLTGQAHLRPASSSWRSNREISKLTSLYGEHACLTFASLQERDRDEAALIEQADRIALHLRMHNQNEFRSRLPLDSSYGEENAIRFWMTNVLDLMNVSENKVTEQKLHCMGQNKILTDVNDEHKINVPKKSSYELPRNPLKLPDYNVIYQVLSAQCDELLNDTFDQDVTLFESSDGESYSSHDGSGEADATTTKNSGASAWRKIMSSANIRARHSFTEQNDQRDPLNQDEIAITFRSNLPEDVPPTISAACVKYFYSAVLIVTTTNDEVFITDCPFTVLTCKASNTINRPQSTQMSSTRVHIGELYAMAHSSSLPYRLSSIDALGERQLRVISDPPACSILSRATAERRTSTHRIQNENGAFCAWITLVGVGRAVVPGTKLGIVVRFMCLDDAEVGYAGVVPCHRVSCALVGEEYALCEGAAIPSSSAGAQSKKRKTRSYVFDSAYEMVEFGFTNAISIDLLLPFDCPVTIKTDLVEVAVSLKLEFTVDRVPIAQRDEKGQEAVLSIDSSEAESGFGVIRLELPVNVVHDDDMAEDEEEEYAMTIQSQLANMHRFWIDNETVAKDSIGFDMSNIHDDLKTLSLRMLGSVE